MLRMQHSVLLLISTQAVATAKVVQEAEEEEANHRNQVLLVAAVRWWVNNPADTPSNGRAATTYPHLHRCTNGALVSGTHNPYIGSVLIVCCVTFSFHATRDITCIGP